MGHPPDGTRYSSFGSSKPNAMAGRAGWAWARHYLPVGPVELVASGTDEGEYYRGILSPMFFDAMATGSSSRGEHPGLRLRSLPERRSVQAQRLGGPHLRRGRGSPYPTRCSIPTMTATRSWDLLSRYRFTTRESTPDDQSVDPDPELLGRVFENLYQGDERHDTGTYYTPSVRSSTSCAVRRWTATCATRPASTRVR